MRVSFVIPHGNRTKLLLEGLRSICRLDHDALQIEVVVVTQDQTLGQSELVAAMREICAFPPALTLLPASDARSISELRNRGARAASGEYLAFIDADIALSPDWIRVMLRTLNAREERVIVSAMQQASADAPGLERIRTELNNLRVDCTRSHLAGSNLFLRRQTFEAVGGFPEHLQTCEDYFFTDSVSQLGELYVTSGAWHVHLGEDKQYLPMARKEIWRGQSNLQSVAGRRIGLGELASFLVPFWVLGTLIAALVAGAALRIDLVAGFVLLAMIPVGLYSLRVRLRARHRLPLADLLRFYLLYFPARAIGMTIGLLKHRGADDAQPVTR